MPEEDKYIQLIRAAREAAANAYAPYTKKGQGAAVLTADGTIVCGVTVESAAYSASLTAEVNAITQAVALGHRKFTAIAIVPFSHPSGLARQVIAEFGIDCDIVRAQEDSVDAYEVIPMRKLLPKHFGPSNIEEDRKKREATGGGAG